MKRGLKVHPSPWPKFVYLERMQRHQSPRGVFCARNVPICSEETKTYRKRWISTHSILPCLWLDTQVVADLIRPPKNAWR